MVTFTDARKKELFDEFEGRKIAVVGDLMLDRYFWGKVTRISPEAPVPVVDIDSEATHLGGAANVVNNLSSLGAIPVPFGVVGDDQAGHQLIHLFQNMNCPTDGIIVDPDRLTAVKTRIIAHNQHVVRADRETKSPITKDIRERLIAILTEGIDDFDAIIFQDYNKGLLIPESIHPIITLAHQHGKVVTVDPKFDNFFEYKGVTLFKPNRKETEQALGIRVSFDQDITEAIQLLKDRLTCENVLITLGSQGMCLLEAGGEITFESTKAQKVHDVSGAGDTVISTLTVALVAGATMKEATTLANYAAGVVVSEIGAVPIYINDLITAVK
ncbi:D-glycero-beta-D-manno-heptose-7-phosphate kinase [candidate division KSB1 bacterium]|nr:D-glycero-beta-D-manno-heptose-7-phosphate kinase [candidate division KSB1 bacterium]